MARNGTPVMMGAITFKSVKAAHDSVNARLVKAGKAPIDYMTFYQRLKAGKSVVGAMKAGKRGRPVGWRKHLVADSAAA
jgi:hypothetical protein